MQGVNQQQHCWKWKVKRRSISLIYLIVRIRFDQSLISTYFTKWWWAPKWMHGYPYTELIESGRTLKCVHNGWTKDIFTTKPCLIYKEDIMIPNWKQILENRDIISKYVLDTMRTEKLLGRESDVIYLFKQHTLTKKNVIRKEMRKGDFGNQQLV